MVFVFSGSPAGRWGLLVYRPELSLSLLVLDRRQTLALFITLGLSRYDYQFAGDVLLFNLEGAPTLNGVVSRPPSGLLSGIAPVCKGASSPYWYTCFISLVTKGKLTNLSI